SNDTWSNQTECLAAGSPDTALDVTVRFLHLTERVVGQYDPPLADGPPPATGPPFRPVESLQVGDRVFYTWQEAKEHRIELTGAAVGEILAGPRHMPFILPARRWSEPLREAGGKVAGVLVRCQQELCGAVEAEASGVADGLFKLTLRVVNRT